jgi:release factor glutamine methyltransferase
VLIPRPETETLVEQALTHLDLDRPVRVLDLGTGSGAIALALAKERPSANITATDVSPAALDVAQRNARRLGIPGINFVAGDWFAPVAGQQFELVASNPPYVAAADPALERQVLEYEPTLALIPGPDGLEAIARIVTDAARHLAARGWLLLEHGWEQAPHVQGLLVQAGFAHVRSHTDLAGRERVTAGCWQP